MRRVLNKPIPVAEPVLRSDTELHRAVRRILPSGAIQDPRGLDGELRALAERLGEEVFSIAFSLLFHVELSPTMAREHWGKILAHHEDFRSQPPREVEFMVSALDYLTRVSKLISNPTVMESERFSEIYQDTITDAMTGLFNFRYFLDVLSRETSRARRYRTPLSLLFFDVDHFKKINDRFGHPAGDDVLRKVARVIATSIRTIDIAFRYGGEEFAVILPETSKEGAVLLAERIRETVARFPFAERLQGGFAITISGGVAGFPDDAEDSEQLISRADNALYAAKENGRNRIEEFNGERRRQLRVAADLPGACAILPERKEAFRTKDLSEGGMLLESAGPLLPGGVVDLEIALASDEQPIRLTVRVAHLRRSSESEAFEVGVTIVRMSIRDLHRYREFLVSRLAA